jgi:hypothetical protein
MEREDVNKMTDSACRKNNRQRKIIVEIRRTLCLRKSPDLDFDPDFKIKFAPYNRLDGKGPKSHTSLPEYFPSPRYVLVSDVSYNRKL